MGVSLTPDQVAAVAMAQSFEGSRAAYEADLGLAVRHALWVGVPLNTLATALGVSRSRVRRLARVEKSE